MIMNMKQIQDLIKKGMIVKFICAGCGDEIKGMHMESGLCLKCSQELKDLEGED